MQIDSVIALAFFMLERHSKKWTPLFEKHDVKQ
jgi:hypothetical protein